MDQLKPRGSRLNLENKNHGGSQMVGAVSAVSVWSWIVVLGVLLTILLYALARSWPAAERRMKSEERSER